ncbi:hypothetical protein HJFPF1_09821 [Paramyrothecium foliicola]|nr:hypothetical protein HJFPF1_09821 [Paramyrothecium foliicola]
MASTLAPFLYQTRTLLRVGKVPCTFAVARHAHFSRRPRRPDNSIPFEWDADGHKPELADPKESTITPSEAEIFKGIFDEISQGKVPRAKKPRSTTTGNDADTEQPSRPEDSSRSLVEQARQTDFAEKFLQRYPQSLRKAAQVALGLYELEPGNFQTTKSLQLDEVDQADKLAERERCERIREKESARVTQAMQKCSDDAQLWKAMEQNVFSLPQKLGILQAAQGSSARPKRTRKAAESKPKDEKYSIDIHGPLFSQYLNTGLRLFDTAFARPSPFIFQILPRIKALGLPAYVLGVSTPFFTNLARIHWDRFGDANSALDVLQEMNSVGLYADEEARELLNRIEDNLHACTWGAQGPFVMAMMDSPPYDSSLTQRLSEMKEYVAQSLSDRAKESLE